MKKKLYNVIVKDYDNVYEDYVISKNKKEIMETYNVGGGEIIRVKDVTNEYFTKGSISRLYGDLKSLGWGVGERLIIANLLKEHLESIGNSYDDIIINTDMDRYGFDN